MSTPIFATWCVGLAWYLFSIVFGRLYTAMHSFTDCVVGVLLGTGIWAFHFFAQDLIKQVVTTGNWTVPVTTILLGLIMVHKHPQPVDDCPCFEDAIAFVSVVMGIIVGWWHGAQQGWPDSAYVILMPGSVYQTWTDVGTWWAFAALKMTVGILAIFAWRLAAKATLHALLPPTFRLLSRGFALPHRRFYTPATDYSSVPAEGLHPIPSVIDLLGHGMEVEQDVLVTSASGLKEGIIRRPNGKARRLPSEESGRFQEKDIRLSAIDVKGEDVKHYDADGQLTSYMGTYFELIALGSFD
jgi:dihydrosphingosine 1-phosphate phosphatase